MSVYCPTVRELRRGRSDLFRDRVPTVTGVLGFGRWRHVLFGLFARRGRRADVRIAITFGRRQVQNKTSGIISHTILLSNPC